MRPLLTILLLLLGATALSWFGCQILGARVHGPELLWAAGACGIASVLAMVPLLLTRHAGQVAVAQAALVATLVHLLMALVLGGALYALLHLPQPFLYWLMGFYWVTLIGVAMAAIRAVKRVPVSTTGPKP